MKLTKRTVDALSYQGAGNAAFYIWDSELIGFGLRIYPSGRKAFLVTYRTGDGRKRFFSLCTHGRDMTPDEARRKCRLVASRGTFSPTGAKGRFLLDYTPRRSSAS